MEEQLQQQIDPTPKQKLWKSLNDAKYYTKSFEDFNQQFSSPEKIDKLYGALSSEKYYTKSMDDFKSQFFSEDLKKKDLSQESESGLATSTQPLQPSQAPTDYPVGQLPQAGTPQNNEFGFETFVQPFAGTESTVPATQLEDVEITASKPTEPSFNLSPERLAQINAAYSGDEKELNKGHNSASSDSGEIKFTSESERKGNRAAYLYNKVLDGVGAVVSGLGDVATMAGASMGSGGNPTVISNAVKGYRQQIAPDVRKYLKETVGANVDKGREAKYNGETITSALGGVFNSASAMALTAASGGLGTGAMFLQSYDNTLESIDQTEEGRNLDDATKTLFAGTVGIATALLEKYSFDKIFKGETGIIGNAIAQRALKNANRETSGKVTGDILTNFLDKEIVNLSNKFVKGGARLADASIVEYVTEAAQEATQAGGELLLNKATGKPVFDTSETSKWDGFLSRVNKAGVAGAIGGAFMGGLSMGISNLAGVKKSDIDESQSRLNDINTALNNEELSPDAQEVLVQEKIKIQNEAQEIADKVDEAYDKLDNKQKDRVNDIVAEQVRIDEAIKDENIPESVKENLTKQSEELNTELSEIKPDNNTNVNEEQQPTSENNNIQKTTTPPSKETATKTGEEILDDVQPTVGEDVSYSVNGKILNGKLKAITPNDEYIVTNSDGTDIYTKELNNFKPIGELDAPEIQDNKNIVEEAYKSNKSIESVGDSKQYNNYVKSIFPESQSKEPLYHGSPNEFDNFDLGKLGKNSKNTGYFGEGLYFTPKKSMADAYGEKTYRVVLDTKNPFKKTAKNFEDLYERLKDLDMDKKLFDGRALALITQSYPQYSKQITQAIKDMGYDSVVDWNETIVFDPKQVHILGTKNDTERFKEFVGSKETKSELRNVSSESLNKIGNAFSKRFGIGYEVISKEKANQILNLRSKKDIFFQILDDVDIFKNKNIEESKSFIEKVFSTVESAADAKSAYKRLATKFHPDRDGGSNEIMQYLNNAKDKYDKGGYNKSGSIYKEPIFKTYTDHVNDLRNWANKKANSFKDDLSPEDLKRFEDEKSIVDKKKKNLKDNSKSAIDKIKTELKSNLEEINNYVKTRKKDITERKDISEYKKGDLLADLDYKRSEIEDTYRDKAEKKIDSIYENLDNDIDRLDKEFDNKWSFQKKGNRIGGFYDKVNKKAYLVEDVADETTAIHEMFSHPFISAIEKEHPELFRNILNEAKNDVQIKEYVDANYGELEGLDRNHEYIAAAIDLESRNQLKNKSLMDYIDEFWKIIKDNISTIFGGKKVTGFDKNTKIKDIVDFILNSDESIDLNNIIDSNITTENKAPIEESKKVSEAFEKLANRSLETDIIRETGSNVEEVTGDTLDFGDKTYKASTFENAIPMGIEVVESAKNEFGKSYVTDLLGYLNDNKNTMSMDKRALITLSLENDLRKQLLSEPENVTLKKQVQLVTKAGIELLREGAKSVSLGRIRRMVDLGYDAEKLTDTFFSAKQKEAKSKLVNAIESTSDDINKEAVLQEQSKVENDQVQADLIEEAVNKGVESQINEIYKKLPSERRKRADKAINAIEKFQKTLRSKTYDASVGVPIAILDAGLTTIKQAIKAGVRVADAIELGIAKIKEKHGKWAKEDEFRKDMMDNFKKESIDTESGTSLTSAETQRKAYIARLEKDIRDLEEQIAKGEKKVVTKEDKYANDAEIKKLRDTRDAKKEELDVADPSYKENQEVERAIKQTTKSITDLENKLANNDLSSDTKNTAVWTKEIGELKLKQQALQEELNEKRKANRPPKPQPTDTEIAEAKLETAKKNVQKRIDDLNTEIANKQRNTKKGVNVVADEELTNLKMQRDVLTKIRDKELPVSRTPITDEAKAKAQVTRLEKEIADLDEQIANGQKTPKNQSKTALTTPQIDKLKAEKQARLDVLNEIDPDKRDLVNKALIDAGFGRDINVKTKDGKEKRTVLDWKKLAGEEGSVDNIRERVEEFLKKKGYSENEILRMQDDLVGQYNDLHASIIEKSLNELENRNKESKPVEAKSEARRLAELYNFGLFERESDTYDNIINRAVGLSQIGQEAFNDAKILARAMATILNTKGADGKPLPEIAVKKALNDVQDAQEKLLTKVANSEADWRYKTANVIGEYASIGQRALLMSLNQVIENPLSGFVERGIQFLGDKATGTMDTPEMRKQRQELAGVQLRDILMNAGDDFGHKKSIFISKSDAMDFINGYKDTKAWHSFTSVFLGRAYLEGADSMHKIALTQRMFSRNAIKILISKGMSKEQATTFVSEKLTGQSFIDAKVEAKNLIRTVNEQAGKDLLPSNDQSVTLLANDLIKANLIDYAGLTERELNIAFKAGYTVAGYGMGHESNNLLSEGIKLVNQKIQGKLKEAIKNKDWGAAAGYRLQNALFNSVLNPFVGGGTNWTVLTLTKMGINPLAYVNALKRTKIDVMTEAGQKTLREDLVSQGRNRGDALRVVTGAAISLALLASTRLTDEDDDFAKWKKRNKVLAKFVDKASPAALIFINAYDQNQAGDEKAMDKAWDKVFGVKAVNYFDDSKKVAKATHIFTPKNETDWQEAWGAIGQLTLGKVNAPVPSWKVVKDFMDIGKALAGEDITPVDYKVGGFFNGAYQGGFVENNGFVNMRPNRIIATYDPKTGKEEVLRGKEKRRYDSLLQLVTAEHVEARKEDLNKLSPSERQEQVKAIATRASKEVLELMSGYSDKTKSIEDGGKTYVLDAKQIRQRIEFAKEYNERYGEKLEKITNALVRKGMSESEAAIEARKEYKSDVNSYTREQMLKLNKRGEITLKEKE